MGRSEAPRRRLGAFGAGLARRASGLFIPRRAEENMQRAHEADKILKRVQQEIQQSQDIRYTRPARATRVPHAKRKARNRKRSKMAKMSRRRNRVA